MDRIRGVKENQRRKLTSGHWIKLIQRVAVYLTKDYAIVFMYAPTLSHKIGIVAHSGVFEVYCLAKPHKRKKHRQAGQTEGKPRNKVFLETPWVHKFEISNRWL